MRNPIRRKNRRYPIAVPMNHKRSCAKFIEKTIKSLIQAGLLDFTESDKILYKVA